MSGAIDGLDGAAMVLERVGAPNVLANQMVRARAPNTGEVLIRNRAAGVNHIDTIIRSGTMPAGAAPPLPHVLGVEGAGVIAAIGPGVSQFAVGQRVFWFGLPGAGGYGAHDHRCPLRCAYR
jgi:NADPH:quinone reductase